MPDGLSRIPPKIVDLLDQTARTTRTRVITALPDAAAVDLRQFALHQVLATVMRDWIENGNTDGLTSQDVHDLRSFVSLAATIADLGQPDEDGLNGTTFRAVLTGLLEDWLANWNSDGVSGPPAAYR